MAAAGGGLGLLAMHEYELRVLYLHTMVLYVIPEAVKDALNGYVICENLKSVDLC